MRPGAVALGMLMACITGSAVAAAVSEYTKIGPHSILAVTLIWGAMFWSYLLAATLATYLLRES